MKTREVNVLIEDKRTGKEVYRKDGFRVPENWTDHAATIVASKYSTDKEISASEIIGRVVHQIGTWGQDQGYFGPTLDDGLFTPDTLKFMSDLTDIIINQRASFNSPVWFNCGVDENNDQMSACFIFPVEDNMEDILQHTVREGMVFKAGSGSGVNVSKLRAKGEKLSNKGEASGPVSFMRMWDACAGSVKSGGKTRRSAKLVCLDVDHPDILEFINCKKVEEDKAKILVDQGVDREEAYQTVFFQNANHSIRVTDEFMHAVENDEIWHIVNRGDGEKRPIGYAKSILMRAADMAWATGDPGIQFHDRMNKDNPVPSLGEIRSTNPCAEFAAIDNSSCNLASLNLASYWDGNCFLENMFCEDIGILITAMDILIDAADYPTTEVRKTTIATRPLGLGFTNLGALLILMGLPYDTDKARAEAAYISRLMTRAAYIQSEKLAKLLGPFEAFEENRAKCLEIAQRLTEWEDGFSVIESIREGQGIRNSQLTLLAPTGTISFMMDCDTTGIEPLFAPKITKTLAGGGTIDITPACAKAAERLKNADEILKPAMKIHWQDHILMMAACQKHLNGSISKTVILPNDCMPRDIMNTYIFAWKNNLKAVAVYRDGSKMLQPLKITTDMEEATEDDDGPKWSPIRRKLPETRRSLTHKFNISGIEGFIQPSMYDDGTLGEIFLKVQKQGSAINGLMDAFAIITSLALQYGVPLEAIADKLCGTRFDPQGITTNGNIPSTTSIMDYIFRWLMQEFSIEDSEINEENPSIQSIIPPPQKSIDASGPICTICGSITIRSGTCYLCSSCGTTTGCS